MFFVRKSFYGMRIESKADSVVAQEKEEVVMK
jgi:hypothetical protein